MFENKYNEKKKTIGFNLAEMVKHSYSNIKWIQLKSTRLNVATEHKGADRLIVHEQGECPVGSVARFAPIA